MQDSLAARSIESFERLLEVLRNLVKTLQDFETSFQGNRQAVRKGKFIFSIYVYVDRLIPKLGTYKLKVSIRNSPSSHNIIRFLIHLKLPADEELWFSLGSSENAALLLQVLNLSEEDAVYLSDDPVYRKDIHW